MSSKRLLAPAFLNKLDHYLLTHKPVTWTTRAHLVIYYAILFALALTLLCFIIPNNPLADSNSFVWTTLTAVLSFIGLIVWIIYLLRFNVFKRFSEKGNLNALKNFCLFFISIGFIIAPSYIPTAVESIRANNKFSNEEVVNDINSINSKINQLEYDSLNHNWSKQICIVRDTLEQSLVYKQNDDDYSDKIRYIDTANLRKKLLETDSVVQQNDSVYYFYTCPKYTFIDANNSDTYTKAKEKNDTTLYRELIQNFNPVNKEKVKEELALLLKKYSYSSYSYNYAESFSNSENSLSYYSVIDKRYNLYGVNSGLRNLVDKKYRWYSNNDSRFRGWLYISFVIGLMIFIFRHTTAKVFFLSLLTVIVLLVVTGVLLAFIRGDVQAIYAVCIAYYFLFLATALAGNVKGTRSTIVGIALNIVTFFTFLLPLFCTMMYYEGLEKQYRFGEYPPGFSERKDFYFLIAEIAGFVLFLVLLQPFFKRKEAVASFHIFNTM
jgi:hypothetical protein